MAATKAKRRRRGARVQVVWEPSWDEVQPAARNIARRSLWRLAPMYDMDDLMQEARIVFLRISRRYPNIIEAPHFMAMFKLAWVNEINTLSNRRTRDAMGHATRVEQTHEPQRDEDSRSVWDRVQGRLTRVDHQPGADKRPVAAVTDESFYDVLLGADPDIRLLVDRLDDPKRPRRMRQQGRRGRRETTNEYLCRLAGVQPERVWKGKHWTLCQRNNLRLRLYALLASTNSDLVV